MRLQCVILLLVPSTMAQVTPNQTGIVVSPPKAFDSRTLTLQLEDLKHRLDGVRGLPVAGIQGALGNASGLQFRERNITMQGTFGASNQIVTTEKEANGALASSDRTVTGPDPTRAQVPASSNDPTAVFAPPQGISPTLSSADRLIEAMNLEYQISTLQSFLERSITDRVYVDSDKKKHSRLQALLGFRISISPPRGSDGKAAVVRIKVRTEKGKMPSVVALMPSQKSYNVFAIDRKRNAFGGAAMVGAFSLGGTYMQRSETVYLYKASDTEAYSDSIADDAVSFGWEFRPVLGRKAVSPGERQMFALVALDSPDETDTTARLIADAEVYWIPFNEKKGTFGTASTLPVSSFQAAPVDVFTSDAIQEGLSPKVTQVTWTQVGASNFVAAFKGSGFFTGTKVAYGTSTSQATEAGLEITSDTSMRLNGKLTDLIHGEVILVGRYGGTTPIKVHQIWDSGKSFDLPEGLGLGLVSAGVTAPGASTVQLQIDLRYFFKQEKLAMVSVLPAIGFLAAIDDAVLPPPINLEWVSCNAGPQLFGTEFYTERNRCLRLTYWVPADLFKKASVLSFRYPFYGPNWTATQPLDAVVSEFEVVRLGQADSCQYSVNPQKCVEGRGKKLKDAIELAKSAEAEAKASLKQAKESGVSARQVSRKLYEAATAAIETERLTAQQKLVLGINGSVVDAAFLRKAQSILDESRKAVEQKLGTRSTGAAAPTEVMRAEAVAEVSASNPVDPIEDVVLAVRGPGNAKCWKARIGGLLFDGANSPSDGSTQVLGNVLTFTVKAKVIKGFDTLMLVAARAGKDAEGNAVCLEPMPPQFLKIPKEKPEPEKPAAATLTNAAGMKVTKGTAPLLEVKGTGLDQVKLIRFGDKGLEFVPDEKGKDIKIALTREVTADLGPAILLLHLANSKILTLSLQIVKSE